MSEDDNMDAAKRMIKEIMRQVGSDDLPPSVQAKRLVQQYRIYERCLTEDVFKPGDLVTPRPEANLKGAGQPHIILEINRQAPQFNGATPGGTTWGRKPEIRVMAMYGETFAIFWCEMHEYEAWKGNIAA